ncbi:Gfo/Idh/MocA family protein [Aeromicrobium chenweiae]|uniref:Gfo/Idh/MocA family protein n=1 Tax=Aeromicrobium chenweiae TaxID=2079793 RepID=UPI001FBA04D1|nr:Gfo/Idh/MocA family oxidoreductase [Aeromicrobium chenweiae]
MDDGDGKSITERLATWPGPAGAHQERPIGVGMVGLSATGGWGRGAHLPAMAAAGGFELRGLVAQSAASGAAASAVHGAPSYASVEELAGADDVDLVVVTVKTPLHRDVVLPALSAGKPVFCEWPFAVDRDEAEKMTAAARGLSTFVGLQGRSTPTFRWLAELVAQGYVGDVLSASVLSTAIEWGTPVSDSMLYTLDRTQGATMLGIAFGHAIDPALMVVGELGDVVATTAVRHPHVPLGRTGRMVAMTADDQIAISGSLPNGAVLSAHQRGGTAGGPSFSMIIDGTEGTLEATAGNHPHLAPVSVRGARKGEKLTALSLPPAYDRFPRLAGSAIHSLTHAYAGIRDELHGHRRTVPDFAHGLRRHRLLDAIVESAATGRRVDLRPQASAQSHHTS